MTNSAQPSGIVSEVGPEHPLDPLTAAQIRQVAAILRRDRGIGGSWRIASIELREPAKDVLAAGEVTGREALAVCWDRTDGQAYLADRAAQAASDQIRLDGGLVSPYDEHSGAPASSGRAPS